MSSFSSVVRKSGASIKPKVHPRRNVTRQVERSSSTAISTPNDNTTASDTHGSGEHTSLSSVPLRENETPVRLDYVSENAQNSPSLKVQPLSSGHASESPRRRSERISAPQNASTQEIGSDENTIERQPPREDSTQSVALASSSATNDRTADESNAPNKRRKLTPRPSPSLVSPQRLTDISHQSPVISPQQLPDRRIKGSYTSVDLIQSATERAASVSSLANDIETQTRARNPRYQTPTARDVHSEAPTENGQSTATSHPVKKRKKKSAAEQAAEIIANIGQNSSDSPLRRNATPDGADEYELEPDEVTMGELVRDRKLGKKSQLEEDMERDWADIMKRRKEAQTLARENAQKRRRKAFGNTVEVPLQATVAIGPRTEVRNGRIVVIEESRQIDRNGALEQAAVLDAENVREDKFYYKRVNQNTVGMKAYAGRKFRWDEQSTDQFFKGLQMFGTDFLMIANMFPGLDRKQVKMKFIREENADKAKVRNALADRIPIDLEEYAKMTDTTLQDPSDLQAEIDAEEARLKEEDHQRRVREGFVTATTAEEPLPTTEGEDPEVANSTADNQSRYATVADEIMAPKKRQRKTGSTARKRGPKANRRPAEGIEEVLGSIDEVRV